LELADKRSGDSADYSIILLPSIVDHFDELWETLASTVSRFLRGNTFMQTESDLYNYTKFIGDEDFMSFRTALPFDYLHAARKLRQDGLRLKPFYAESVGFRWTDDPAFQAGLGVAGQQAIDDIAEAIARWYSGTPLKGSLSIEEG
jgi:hypothetical protein